MASLAEGDAEGVEPGSLGGGGDAPSLFQRGGSQLILPGDEIAIIREVYDSENAREIFEAQLERALEDGVRIIVIEPIALGDETARWIHVGNSLHKSIVLAGLGCIVTAQIWPTKSWFYLPLGIVSAGCWGLYSFFWQYDACCPYQISTDGKILQDLAMRGIVLRSSSPVVLVRKDDTRRRILHTAFAFAALGQLGIRGHLPFTSRFLRRPLGSNWTLPLRDSRRFGLSS